MYSAFDKSHALCFVFCFTVILIEIALITDYTSSIYRQMQVSSDSVLGEEHPSTLKSMNNLAFPYLGKVRPNPRSHLISVMAKMLSTLSLGALSAAIDIRTYKYYCTCKCLTDWYSG